MKIFYALYELRERGFDRVRKGALLKVLHEDGEAGYADCHPWPELGDQSLSEQLQLLSKNQTTHLTEQSLYFAKIDAQARRNNINLFSGLEIPSSHHLLATLEEEIPAGFTKCKIKVGKDPEKEKRELPVFFSKLPESVSVRLDFNCRTDKAAFIQYLDLLRPFLEKMDFIEDPFPFEPNEWEMIQNVYGVKLASDRNSDKYSIHSKSHAITVLKPAVQDCVSAIKLVRNSIVITSYLDHPLGQLCAAYSAAIIMKEQPKQIEKCGLLSHVVYRTNKYSEQLNVIKDRLVPIENGFGFGFDALLAQENWVSL